MVRILLYFSPHSELAFPTPATKQVISSPLICSTTFTIYQVPMFTGEPGSKSCILSHWPVIEDVLDGLGSALLMALLPSSALAVLGDTTSGYQLPYALRTLM